MSPLPPGADTAFNLGMAAAHIPFERAAADAIAAQTDGFISNQQLGVVANNLRFNVIIIDDGRGGAPEAIARPTDQTLAALVDQNYLSGTNLELGEVLADTSAAFHRFWPDNFPRGGS